MRFKRLDEWLLWLEQLHPEEIDLGLERVVQVAAQLPINTASSEVITVAGTNGKGSTCLLYTSPSPRDRTRSRMPSSA